MKPVGRFAPTPSGRMHMGNVLAALMAWLAVRSQGGTLILRMEDLDTQRTSREKADILRRDLLWLGFDWDAETTPQSQRTKVYDRYFERLMDAGLLYPCYCTRSQLHSVNAPHLSDGTFVYPGTCRNLQAPPPDRSPAWRIKVPAEEWTVQDLLQGTYREDLSIHCGDFILRRGDGAYVYQLATTIDDAEAGVNQVVRGLDLLSSCPRQMYLQRLFGFSHPQYAHIPLLLAPDGRRLSKRDRDMDLSYLRQHYSPQQLIGILAHAAGLQPSPTPVTPGELTGQFSWDKLQKASIVFSLPD